MKTDFELASLVAQMRHSEASLIWQRYGIMLVADSLVLTSMFQDSAIEFRTLIVIFGIAISLVWLLITSVGWEILNAKIAWEESYSKKYQDRHQKSFIIKRFGIVGDWIKWCAFFTPTAFVLLYVCMYFLDAGN